MRRLKIRADQQVRLIDKKFIEHLAEMHPVSALHEFCQRMDWPAPNFFQAFECGPPMMRLYIFKVRKCDPLCLVARYFMQYIFSASWVAWSSSRPSRWTRRRMRRLTQPGRFFTSWGF